MAAEKVNVRKASVGSGTVQAIKAPNDRQTYVPQTVPKRANGVAAQVAGAVPAVLARNARQTHIQAS
jgi:hypothetical protein